MKTIFALSFVALLFFAAFAEARIGDRRANRHARKLNRIESRQDARASRQHLRGGLLSNRALRRGDVRGLRLVPVEPIPAPAVPKK